MSGVVSAVAIGLMVIVLLIAVFSLIVLVIIPIGRFLSKRAERENEDETPA